MRMQQEQRPSPLRELRLLLRQLYERDIEPTEVGIILAQLYWGVLLLLPPRTFATGVAYRAMAGIASEEAWGVLALALAAIPALALWRQSYGLRALGLLGSVGWFVFITVTVVYSNRYGTGGIYALFALGSAWAFRRILADHGDEIGVVRRLRSRGRR